MRRYGMYDVSRGLTLAFAAGLVGLALWGATQVGTQTPGRFWTAMVIVGAAGLVLALANHVGSWTKGLRLRLSPSTFALAFLPALVCVGWILIASQPASGWEEGRIDSWSNTLGILGAVHAIGLWRGVLAFGLGIVLGLSLDGVPAVPAADASAADEPVTAERRYSAANRAPSGEPAPPAEETAQTRDRIQAH
jgi:hypothetical protein